MRNVSDKISRENQNTHFMFSNFFKKWGHLWDSVENVCTACQATDDNIIGRMCIVCWIPKTTNTHSENLIYIAFEIQQCLHERVSILTYTYFACLVRKWRYLIFFKYNLFCRPMSNIFFSAWFWNILNILPYFWMWDQVSYPCKITGSINFLYFTVKSYINGSRLQGF